MKRSSLYRNLFLCSLLLLLGCATSGQTANVRDADTVLQQLEDLGIDPFFSGPASQRFLSTPGQAYTVNQHGLQLYVYRSKASAVLDARRVGSQELSVFDRVHFYQGGNIIALYFGDDPTVQRALSDVVGPLAPMPRRVMSLLLKTP